MVLIVEVAEGSSMPHGRAAFGDQGHLLVENVLAVNPAPALGSGFSGEVCVGLRAILAAELER
jgi:hypothetical protein